MARATVASTRAAKTAPVHFATAVAFRAWLKKNHATAAEIIVALRKKSAPPPGLTYAEALDEALCFGWIDGVRKRVDELSFTQRFTPRKPTSVWSLINIGHVERLTKAGRMMPAGEKAFAARTAARSGIYSFENRPRELSSEFQRRFKSDKAAWKFFEQQPPGYQRLMIFWVMSAKRDQTRARRIARLISASKRGRRVGVMTTKK